MLWLLTACSAATQAPGSDAAVAPGVDEPSEAGAQSVRDASTAPLLDADDSQSRFEAALEAADPTCERDSDCELLEANTLCGSYCHVYAFRSGRGLTSAREALAAITDHCSLDPDGGRPYPSAWCSAEGLQATCRAQRCEPTPSPCSEGCALQGGTCVGPPGVPCDRCPVSHVEALGQPCRVNGQMCLGQSSCDAYIVCSDELSGQGAASAPVWTYASVICREVRPTDVPASDAAPHEPLMATGLGASWWPK